MFAFVFGISLILSIVSAKLLKFSGGLPNYQNSLTKEAWRNKL
jgi:hypothetical protein